METELLLTSDLTVNEVIRQLPATVGVFHRFGIDACCGGALRIGEAAARHGHPLEELLEALAREAPEAVLRPSSLR